MRVEAFSSGRPGRENEDFAIWDDGVAVLLDGAGMPDALRPPCVHGVSWFARTLGAALRSAASSSETLQDALALAIAHTADLHRGTCAVEDALSPSATVAALRVREDAVEWLVLGDCTLLLERGHSVEAISDDRLASVAQEDRAAMNAAPPGSAERRQLHSLLVQAERALRNRPGGYWVAAADPRAAEAALFGSCPREDVVRAALLTDGAARLTETFALTDWTGCLDILEDQGPESLIRRVREAELTDASMTHWPRSKPHDDATAVYVRP
ncbi:protein phosphatase 2C domain-containing protein [Streptomyces sp. NBC_00572]|uniref:protein phosphatase 2C domain-containing protein n=1 Tax=Streptomyces sp. NBC_00572 TaxID=2903664 RepID=UPI0022530CB0|nr:protein phosphatase 2C domain-containing protein [Streptomyces sp. NBC_00572]MCX4984551.1 protein phosphatase 2C domain-containing protein [Streptomyces sp. NBC_00572]